MGKEPKPVALCYDFARSLIELSSSLTSSRELQPPELGGRSSVCKTTLLTISSPFLTTLPLTDLPGGHRGILTSLEHNLDLYPTLIATRHLLDSGGSLIRPTVKLGEELAEQSFYQRDKELIYSRFE